MSTPHDPRPDDESPHPADDDLLGAWAVGALDAGEAAAVERRLADDPDARLEADRLRSAVDDLVEAAAVTPPPDLWNRIEAQLEPAPLVARREADHADPVASGGPNAGGELDGRRARRAERRRSWAWATAGAVAAALLLIAGIGLGRSSGGGEADDVAQQLRAEATRLSQTSDARTATLTGPGGTVSVVVGADGRAILEADLAAVPDDRTYQLWSIDGPAPVSLGLLGPTPDVVVVGTGTATQLAVSAEPATGSTAPSTTPVVTGRLT